MKCLWVLLVFGCGGDVWLEPPTENRVEATITVSNLSGVLVDASLFARRWGEHEPVKFFEAPLPDGHVATARVPPQLLSRDCEIEIGCLVSVAYRFSPKHSNGGNSEVTLGSSQFFAAGAVNHDILLGHTSRQPLDGNILPFEEPGFFASTWTLL